MFVGIGATVGTGAAVMTGLALLQGIAVTAGGRPALTTFSASGALAVGPAAVTGAHAMARRARRTEAACDHDLGARARTRLTSDEIGAINSYALREQQLVRARRAS